MSHFPGEHGALLGAPSRDQTVVCSSPLSAAAAGGWRGRGGERALPHSENPLPGPGYIYLKPFGLGGSRIGPPTFPVAVWFWDLEL